MRQVRGLRGWCGIVALAGSVGACETARNPGGIQRDLIPPTIKLKAAADTEQIASGLSFTVTASDNLSLADIQLTYSGGYIAQTDTVFRTATPSYDVSKVITFPSNSGAGGLIKIVGKATDGAGNYAVDSIFIFLSNVQALKVFLLAPSIGALASQGRRIMVQVHAENSSVKPASVDIGFTFQTQQADNQLLVNDGETAVIGGLTVTSVTVTKSGIPFLVDLPVLGKLFGFTSQSEQRRDLLILITPHIIDDLTSPNAGK
jgi:hypothetical protein